VDISELLLQPEANLDDPIELCGQGNFRWGACQAIVYDPRKPTFPQPFLYSLYERTRLSGQRHPLPLDLNNRATLGLLPSLFCGMTNLGPDAICAYLSARAVCVVGEWRTDIARAVLRTDSLGKDVVVFEGEGEEEKFHPLGYCFPSTGPTTSEQSKTGIPSNAMFAGYAIFSEAWRTPQQQVLMYLGLAWLFHTFKLVALHGSRYQTNHLTARWTRQFGFQDCGTLPYCMAGEPGGLLVPGVFSTLLRKDFEERLREVLEKIRAQSFNDTKESTQ
jgi:hypothetical protein